MVQVTICNIRTAEDKDNGCLYRLYDTVISVGKNSYKFHDCFVVMGYLHPECRYNHDGSVLSDQSYGVIWSVCHHDGAVSGKITTWVENGVTLVLDGPNETATWVLGENLDADTDLEELAEEIEEAYEEALEQVEIEAEPTADEIYRQMQEEHKPICFGAEETQIYYGAWLGGCPVLVYRDSDGECVAVVYPSTDDIMNVLEEEIDTLREKLERHHLNICQRKGRM